MQVAMIGLGRMGANMVRRLMRAGHECVVFDRSAQAVAALTTEGATGASSSADLVKKLRAPRAICLMVPAAVVDAAINDLLPHMSPDDVLIDGGNSHYQDDIARASLARSKSMHFVDMGTSGGVWGLERGYCLMIGGEPPIVKRLEPFFTALAPRGGYLHCGPSGAGRFVKMVHNGIEYGLMAAYAEGLSILKHANAGTRHAGNPADAETTPLRNPEAYQYDLDLAAITEVWRHGSVITSWLLDLTAEAFSKSPQLENFAGHVSDSGEGRWTLQAANDEGVPAHVLAAALFERFASRSNDDFQNRVLSAMRLGFGGHVETVQGSRK